MKRIGRVSLYILLGSFIFIQFLRTEKNVSDEVSPFDFLEVNADMPDTLQSSFITSCGVPIFSIFPSLNKISRLDKMLAKFKS